MVIGIDDVIPTFFHATISKGKVGNHFIGIHIDTRPRPALKLVSRELV